MIFQKNVMFFMVPMVVEKQTFWKLYLFFQKVEGETLKQCMEKCVVYEGGISKVNKTTCKSRCGAATVEKSPIGKRDCMIDFKLCNRTCGKEKIGQLSPCHKQCKVLLRMCT